MNPHPLDQLLKIAIRIPERELREEPLTPSDENRAARRG